MNLEGKTALVTGSAVRIGRSIAKHLAANGCNLVLHYHSSGESIDSLVEELHQFPIKTHVIKADFTVIDEVLGLFPKILQKINYLDILINNAGIYLPGKGLQTNLNTWETQFNINLKAPFFLTKEFAQQLPAGLHGRVVNIADAKVLNPLPDHFAYRLTKYALIEMTKMYALELAPFITVNAIALGIMLPLAGQEDIDINSLAERRVPLKIIGSPDIAAQNVLHLLKQDFMTGSIIKLDGGEFL